jgi:chloramphenicol-sensitive protein RarD
MPQRMKEQLRQHRIGVVYAAVAFFAWGVLPFYWKALKTVPSIEILAHRILWSFVFTSVILMIRKRMFLKELLKDAKNRRALMVTGALIGVNWFTYVYAVNSARIVEASMGYYINPLLSVVLGIVILRERLNLLQIIAFLLACAGVLYLTIDYGRFPWIALLLACAFGLYGLFKKTTAIESMAGLMIETMLLSPIALGILFFQAFKGNIALLHLSRSIDFLLILAGVVTVLPLYWFAQGAKRIPLSSVGFLQYIAPTLMLVIGIFVYNETFTRAHLISFVFIWVALGLYSLTLAKASRLISLKTRS